MVTLHSSMAQRARRQSRQEFMRAWKSCHGVHWRKAASSRGSRRARKSMRRECRVGRGVCGAGDGFRPRPDAGGEDGREGGTRWVWTGAGAGTGRGGSGLCLVFVATGMVEEGKEGNVAQVFTGWNAYGGTWRTQGRNIAYKGSRRQRTRRVRALDCGGAVPQCPPRPRATAVKCSRPLALPVRLASAQRLGLRPASPPYRHRFPLRAGNIARVHARVPARAVAAAAPSRLESACLVSGEHKARLASDIDGAAVKFCIASGSSPDDVNSYNVLAPASIASYLLCNKLAISYWLPRTDPFGFGLAFPPSMPLRPRPPSAVAVCHSPEARGQTVDARPCAPSRTIFSHRWCVLSTMHSSIDPVAQFQAPSVRHLCGSRWRTA